MGSLYRLFYAQSVLIFAAALVLGILPADTSPMDAAKGSALYKGCKAEVRLAERPSASDAPQADLVGGSYCVGYLNGFISSLAGLPAPLCMEKQPMVALVRAYVRFMDENPQYLQEDKRVGVRLALQSAFGCPASPSNPGS